MKPFLFLTAVLIVLVLLACKQSSLETVSLQGPRGQRQGTTDSGYRSPLPLEQERYLGWVRLDTTGGGMQTGIAVHPTNPDIAYMASDNGGLFKTENGGDNWF